MTEKKRFSIREALHRNKSDSIIRRSFFLLAITAPALLLNLAYLAIAGRILDLATFGLLYTSISAVNILVSPVQIFNLYLVQRVARAAGMLNKDLVWSEYRAYLRGVTRWGVPIAATALAIGFLGTEYFNFESKSLMFWIILTAFVIYISESVRGVLQGIEAISAIGYFMFCYLGLRLLLSLGALAQFHRVWMGVAGIAVASIISFFIFYRYIHAMTDKPRRLVKVESNPGQTMGVLGYYGITVIFLFSIMYCDNLVMYLGWPKETVGVYSRACIWPKMLYILTIPVLQVYFPVLIRKMSSDSNELDTRPYLLKSLLATLGISVMVLLFLFVVPEKIIAVIMGEHGDFALEMKLLRTLTVAIAPICLLRVVIYDQLARKNILGTVSLVPAFLLQALILGMEGADILKFLNHFVLVNWGMFAVYYYFIVHRKRTSQA